MADNKEWDVLDILKIVNLKSIIIIKTTMNYEKHIR